MSYVRTLTICLLLVYFVSAAGCHCFDLCRRAILGYEGFPEVPQFVVYGGIRLAGNYLEIDIKDDHDDETEEFFNRSLNASLE